MKNYQIIRGPCTIHLSLNNTLAPELLFRDFFNKCFLQFKNKYYEKFKP